MSRHLSISFALALALPTVACVNHSSSGGDDSQDVSNALEQSNGGLDTADEAPQFGAQDQIAAAAIEADASADDSLATDPATTAMDTASAAAGYRLAVVWGKMPADKGAQDTRDWTGSFKISRGGLVVRRTIGFEDATDKLLPRANLQTVNFQSVTRPAIDGLALTVLDPTAATATAPLTLTYTPANTSTTANGGTSYSIDLSQLVAGPVVIDAGDGYKMVAVAHRRQAAACDRGFMRGRWHALSPHLGDFLGVVTDENGAPDGTVRGIYGQRQNGDSVVFGKFIDLAGKFRGLLIGSFENGEYHARWIDRQGDHGSAHGAYSEGSTATGGAFLGRWAEASCSDDPPTTAPTAPTAPTTPAS
jgi:hypothetical protein